MKNRHSKEWRKLSQPINSNNVLNRLEFRVSGYYRRIEFLRQCSCERICIRQTIDAFQARRRANSPSINAHQFHRIFVEFLFEFNGKLSSALALESVKNFAPIDQTHVKRNFIVLRGYESRRDAFVSLFLFHERDDGVRVEYEFRLLRAQFRRAAPRGGIG